MKTLFQNCRGSILMEFLIVFPIYLVLWAGVFMVGDMLVHSIRLPSAERTLAFELGGGAASGWQRVQNTLFHPDTEVGDDLSKQDQLEKAAQSAWYADLGVEGAWSLRSAVKVRDDYKLLAGGTAGQLLFLDWYFADITKGARATGDFANLIRGRRVSMFSKNVDSARLFNYYTLKRGRYTSGFGWRDDRRCASDLLCNIGYGREAWNRRVANESWHDRIGDQPSNGGGAPPATARGGSTYTRHPQLVQWSR